MWKVQLFKLNYDERELAAVTEVVKSGWITMGEKTKEFEARFADFLGGVSAVAVTNGTAALHLALLALGVGPGDEVIVPSLTFVADLNTVKMVGATPILADCTSLEDWNINPADIEKKITAATRAVMIVHYAGYPCDMDAIPALCEKYKLPLIEDCAHAPGARYRGKAVGAFGEVGCFSFFTNKNLSVGEGGMVVTSNPAIAQEIRYLRSHGMTTLTLDRHEGRALTYDVVRPGLNYRIDEIRAALGMVQLEKLPNANLLRKQLIERYIVELCGYKGLSLPFHKTRSEVEPVYHIFPVLLPDGVDRNQVVGCLKEQGVQASIHYPAMQDFTAYHNVLGHDTPIANEISQRELTLPLFPTMTNEQQVTVIRAMKAALGG